MALDEATGAVVNAKALSTPRALLDGVLHCVDQAGVRLEDCRLVIHGTTIGINALLEGKGARTGLVTTEGFRDVLEIGRGNFLRMYDVLYRRPTPLVPRGRCLEVPERLDARGEILVRSTRTPSARPRKRLAGGRRAGGRRSSSSSRIATPRTSSVRPRSSSRRCPASSISVSHRLTQEWREYERTSTTVVNAYVQPIVDRYLGEFGQGLAGRGFTGQVLITQSNGGAFSLEAARTKPVHTIESGPAAGAVGCASLARVLGLERVDLVRHGRHDGEVRDRRARARRHDRRVPRRWPAAAHPRHRHQGSERGRRHRSRGSTRAARSRSGPQSAGAEPGPVCYALGGTAPTVTDANVVLGRIDGSRFLGGTMPLDAPAAARALDEQLAQPLGPRPRRRRRPASCVSRT